MKMNNISCDYETLYHQITAQADQAEMNVSEETKPERINYLALEAICDGASWPLGGKDYKIAEIEADKIIAGRAALALAKG